MVLMAFLPFLFGQEALLPVYRTPGSIPMSSWTCDGTKSAAEARTISLSAMDFAKDSEGRVMLGYDQQLRTWVPKGMGLGLLRKEAAPGAVASGASVAKVKYRNGHFWVGDQDHARVLQWDSRARAWRVALDPGFEFQDFEVSFHGQIVLIGTFHPKNGEKRLIECFEADGRSPVSVENYPPSGLTVQDEKRCSYNWALPVTCASDEFIVTYFSMAGRLFVYDTSAHALREISTPWTPLNSEWLNAQDREFGVLNMNVYPGMNCLQFVPTSSRNSIGIAYQVSGKAPRKNVLVEGKAKLVPVGPDKDPEPVKVVELDLVNMKLEPTVSDVAPRLPIWLKSNGTYGLISEVLKTSDSVPAPMKAKVAPGTEPR